ncbi:MAG: hypothetical protein ISP55_05810 [Flavobacteriales bacterium]|nr:hypothetical protein [Flavobacteriales bacterium]
MRLRTPYSQIAVPQRPLHPRIHAFVVLMVVFLTTGWQAVAQGLIQDPPAGLKDGITVLSPDRAHLQLRAPAKDHVHLRGDFNGWAVSSDFLMNRSVDGNTWWLELEGLAPGAWTRFHYLIDDTVEVADPYAPVILDPWNDGYVPAETFPARPVFPWEHASWPVAAFRTVEPDFVWTDADFQRPSQDRLVIYELLVRDWDAERDFGNVLARLDYLEWLGINAIELMPVSEFDGNTSWGYNPGPRFAVDKAYGTATALKQLVDAAHDRGIAVILDIVPNHSFGLDPMVRMYQDSDGGVASGNPWFNEDQIHPYGLGFDFDHGDPWTREFWKRVMDHWMDEFHIDGYRFDLSKGLTQSNTLGNVGAWNAYDQGRVDILFDYAQHIWAQHPGAYLILEHLGDNAEETALANGGFMLWGKSTSAFAEAILGYGGDFSWASWQARGWSWPNLVAYMESHDEQRIAHDLLLYGNAFGGYDAKLLGTAMDRLAMGHAFLMAMPGPKMMYQWGEFGYDVSIFDCGNGTYTESCKLDEKPEPWQDRALVAERQGLARKIKNVCDLKREEPVFGTYDYNIDFGGMGKRLHLYSPGQNVVLCGNFDVVGLDMVPGFPHLGTWTDALTGDTHEVTDLGATFYFAPGQYHLWMDTPVVPVSPTAPLPLEVVCNDAAAVNFGEEADCVFEVTLALDATDIEAAGLGSASGYHVAGSFQGWDPSGTPLVDMGDDRWEVTVLATVGSLLQFKFINGNTWDGSETVPAGCGADDGFGGYNREVLVTGEGSGDTFVCFGACAACVSNLDYPGCMDAVAVNFDDVANVDDGSCVYPLVFQVDVSNVDPAPTSVLVAGSFQGWDVAATPMSDAGDGLWTLQVNVPADDTLEYKYLVGPEWDLAENVPAACGTDDGFGGYNRALTTLAGLNAPPVVCFGDCDVCTNDDGGPAIDGAQFCGPGTVWDAVLELCIGDSACPEDVDGDGLVGASDVLAMLSAFGGLCP